MTQAAEIAPPDTPTQTSLTPLAALLLAQNPALGMAARGGPLSVGSFGSLSGELTAMLHSVGLYDLGFRAALAVTGEDRFRWLNGMVTNAVPTLAEGQGNYNFLLSAQGRIQGDGYVYRDGARLLLHTDRSQAGTLVEHLDRFIIMDDVELSDLSGSITAVGLAGPDAATLLASLGIDAEGLAPLHLKAFALSGIPVTLVRAYSVLVPRFELWFAPEHTGQVWPLLVDAGAVACGLLAQESLRILEGTPLYGVDIVERNLVQETSQARALNFTKGCYLGQEIVERIRSRTTVHRFLRQLELDGPLPPPGTALTTPDEEKALGQITSAAAIDVPGAAIDLPGFRRTIALGYVRGEALERKSLIQYTVGTQEHTAAVLDGPLQLAG